MAKKTQRKVYSDAFRREAVRLADQPGREATEVARELAIHFGADLKLAHAVQQVVQGAVHEDSGQAH